MRHETLRVPAELAEEITRRARIKGVPDADYYRLLIERGLLLESVDTVDRVVDIVKESLFRRAIGASAKLCSRPGTSFVPWLPRASTARFRRLRQ